MKKLSNILKIVLWFSGISIISIVIFYIASISLIKPRQMAMGKIEIAILKELKLGRVGLAKQIKNSPYVSKIYVLHKEELAYDIYGGEVLEEKKYYALLVKCYSEEKPFIAIFDNSLNLINLRFLNVSKFMEHDKDFYLKRYNYAIANYKEKFLNSIIFNLINPYAYAIYQSSLYLKSIDLEEL